MLKTINVYTTIHNLRGGGSYLVECIHGKSSVHSSRSFVSLLSLTSFKDGSVIFAASPPLNSCLSNSLSTEKLIGNPGARAEFAWLSPFWSDFDISDSTLKDIPRAVARLFCSIDWDSSLRMSKGCVSWAEESACRQPRKARNVYLL